MFPLVSDLSSDLRFALRQIRKNPALSLIAVLTLALGIGANTAIFSVADSVLFEPLPYPDADRLVNVFESRPDGGMNSVSGGAFRDWFDSEHSFEYLAVIEETRRNLTGVGEPERVQGLQVSADFLPVLGVEPLLGRGFMAGEDQPGGNNHVLVLTHGFWQSRFAGEVAVLGQSLSLDQITYTVIGVLPPDALLQDEARYLIPIIVGGNPHDWQRSGHWREVVGRLAPGVAAETAQAELRAVKARLTPEYPQFKEKWSVALVPVQEVYAQHSRPVLGILLGTVAMVLLIACANVSSLLLARGQARSREMAIRTALGAHRWRIVRQMLVESLVLAFLGCGLGLLLAQYAIDILGNMTLGRIPGSLRPELDGTVLLFSGLLACGSGLLFGLLPALSAARRDSQNDLKETERGSTSGAKKRAQSILVAAEYALTVVLLVGAGLLLRSFVVLLDTDPGFEPRQVLAFDLSFADASYPEPEDRLALIEALKTRIRALPGVDKVASTKALPLSNRGQTEMASRAENPERSDYTVIANFIDPEYLQTLGIPLLRGRGLTAADNRRPVPRVLLIDSVLAEDLFGDEDPIGQSLYFWRENWEIVGIVSPIRQMVLDIDPRPTLYLPQADSPGSTSIAVKTSLPPATMAEAIRQAVLSVDPNQPIANVRTLEQDVHASLGTRRTILTLLGGFAAVAIGLACLGIYGLTAFTVARRARELGIRSALGARRRDLFGLVLRGGLGTALVGIALGLLVALPAARLLESLLFQVEAHDPRVYLATVLLLMVMATVSIFLPARRAANADPTITLRCE